MRNRMCSFFKKIRWQDAISFVLLLILEMSIHPLGIGPDRRIHDPAVYRLADPGYMPGDWYTQMAVESGVYVFYAKLVNVWHFLPFHEETWRLCLYIASLLVIYYVMIRIARLFSQSALVIPVVAVFHAIVVVVAPPIWLYGPFIQVDGGLAPRSIGIAFSFLALYCLLKNKNILPWVFLGIATLIHVSNSLIIFTLFFAAWLSNEWVSSKRLDRGHWFTLGKKAGLAVMIYVVSGGWFALYVASLGSGVETGFSDAKFIWTWIYFRAPYMALPLMPWKAWLLFFLHILALFVGWYLLRTRAEIQNKKALDLLGYVGAGAVLYFFVFYLFAFVWPWLLGFQFYSIRVVYFAHFVAYIFTALLLLPFLKDWTKKQKNRIFLLLLITAASILFVLSDPGRIFFKRVGKNLSTSWVYVTRSDARAPGLSGSATTKYLALHPEPFLAPPNWFGLPLYLPHATSYKTFGFTPKGLEEWYMRMNDVSRGELERIYETQMKSGRFEPVSINWSESYSSLTEEEIRFLAEKYSFRLFLTYKNKSYPFQLVAEDGDYRLYKIAE